MMSFHNRMEALLLLSYSTEYCGRDCGVRIRMRDGDRGELGSFLRATGYCTKPKRFAPHPMDYAPSILADLSHGNCAVGVTTKTRKRSRPELYRLHGQAEHTPHMMACAWWTKWLCVFCVSARSAPLAAHQWGCIGAARRLAALSSLSPTPASPSSVASTRPKACRSGRRSASRRRRPAGRARPRAPRSCARRP